MPAFKKLLKNYNFWMVKAFLFSCKTSEINSNQVKWCCYPDFHPAKHSTFHLQPEVDPWEPCDQHHTLARTWSSCGISVYLPVHLGIRISEIFLKLMITFWFLPVLRFQGLSSAWLNCSWPSHSRAFTHFLFPSQLQM